MVKNLPCLVCYLQQCGLTVDDSTTHVFYKQVNIAIVPNFKLS
jgi:hypothetical protein